MNSKTFVRSFFTAALTLALCTSAPRANAQQPTSPGLTLTPAVIMVTAKPGQVFYQELRLWNNTLDEMRFHMEAEDIVVNNNKRILVPAGELEGGIARYAVFTENDLDVMPGSSVSTSSSPSPFPTRPPRAPSPASFAAPRPSATDASP